MNEGKIKQAGKIAAEVVSYAKSIIKPGMKFLEIADKVDDKVLELGGKPTFPINLSIDEVVTHATPSWNDGGIARGLLKVGIGVHVDDWWAENELWYERQNITKEDFQDYSFKNGLDKGDIILLWNRGDRELGDIIVFEAGFNNPLIHRIVEKNETAFETKGDNNFGQLAAERNIYPSNVLGKGIAKIPGLGWIKLIFFEGSRPAEQRGFCR
ncbi:hypothetical protein COU62_02090 [Candidatus Pacearchaeota archaeon CG10_big_fil_rev_8_21_14_0_10_35_219]|nr:M24 family metallopeptidase [Candidatus Pacearchaeota archaeon]PIO07983.1 MAG: hypothetical protein COU62_02090 [Candidatus Pacearchaeota archaeon CG10_big_fil_rev_8_21_14_0_10_35_219]PIY81437.1 MAG: hypothetical protein COY79_02895 [Candidatus Pacearchaeota archaeon CG_4_10_14_0_8_um_filter_35_169]PIZ80599.1 MAG: hypothetical protein COY00_00550 [Candidatus Pacearchaeota archaeon CG_4_10_14_0_2_um_filter_35_33]PJA70096.1 MAG: hypothetical protein CO155_01515 [Candidatus Pacearchaeota archae